MSDGDERSDRGGPSVTEHGASESSVTGRDISESSTAADGSRGRVVAVCGLPGAGKTTVAERIADRLGGAVVRTDVIRKALFDNPQYTDAETAAVYDELLARARDRAADGSAVVLDATFADGRFREDAREAAAAVAADFDLVEVTCDEAVVRRRIERRDGVSDADFEIHRRFRRLFDPLTADRVVIDNSGTQRETFAQVDAAFDARADADAE